ncbi:MAG: hypothetical protein Q9209_002206 [Squamulea sp. 1 TL-2023]
MSISTALTSALLTFEEFVTHVNHAEYMKENEVPAASWTVQLNRLHTLAPDVDALGSDNSLLAARLWEPPGESPGAIHDETLKLLNRLPGILEEINTDKLLGPAMVLRPQNVNTAGAGFPTDLQMRSQEIEKILKWLGEYAQLVPNSAKANE